MCVYLCVGVSLCMYVCVCMYMWAFICVYLFLYMYLCVCACMYVCICMCMFLSICVYLFMWVRVCVSYLGFLLLWWNIMMKRQVWEERVLLAFTSEFLFITDRKSGQDSNRSESQRQELIQRSWRDLLAFFSWLVFLWNPGPAAQGLNHPPWLGPSSTDH